MRGLRGLFLVVLPLLMVGPAYGQHAQTRLQWQPQTENDARLQQSVRMEILGRAVVTGLPLLSEKTGVKLTVAPEEVETLGERKFTLIAQGVDLKSVMVRLAEALQECHWDVEVGGEQPVYLLHREPGAEAEAQRQFEGGGAEDLAERRAAREARAEEARAALKMSPEELAELEKTDPMLARAVRDPLTRGTMEAFLSLPPEQVQHWRSEGTVFVYDQAPETVRTAAARVIDWYAQYLETHPEFAADTWLKRFGTPGAAAAAMGDLKRWQGRGSHITVRFSDEGCDFGFGVRLLVDMPIGDGGFYFSDVALPARYVSTDEGSWAYERMLKATGAADHDAAWETITETEKAGFRLMEARIEANRKAARVVPTDSDLLQVVKAPPRDPGDVYGSNPPDAMALLQSIAAQTGLSIVSDYFTGREVMVTDEMREGKPLWEFLYRMGEDGNGHPRYEWKKTGSFLVLHGADWPYLVAQELPESLLLAYQEKLKQQGRFTLEDLAAFAVELGDRKPGYRSLPEGLARTGLGTAAAGRMGLRFYATLSPPQVGQARSEAGLPYAEMTIAQRQMVARMAGRCDPPLPQPAEAVRQGVFRITEETKQRGRGTEVFDFTTVTFTAQFGEAKYQDFATLVVPAEGKKGG